MACPKCGCNVTYPYEPFDDWLRDPYYEQERCSACNYIFYSEESLPDDDPCDEYPENYMINGGRG